VPGRNLILILNKYGKIKNIESDGITNQKTLVDNWDIFWISLVSMYNQIIANTETRGMEARMPPIKELFFEASETATIIIAEITTLII
jgi:hypothetical protein